MNQKMHQTFKWEPWWFVGLGITVWMSACFLTYQPKLFFRLGCLAYFCGLLEQPHWHRLIKRQGKGWEGHSEPLCSCRNTNHSPSKLDRQFQQLTRKLPFCSMGEEWIKTSISNAGGFTLQQQWGRKDCQEVFDTVPAFQPLRDPPLCSSRQRGTVSGFLTGKVTFSPQ